MPSSVRRSVAATEAGLSSGCMRMVVAEVAELNERVQRLFGSRKRRIRDHVELGFGRTVAIACEVMADVLDAFF
jgi:hypothetical protein